MSDDTVYYRNALGGVILLTVIGVLIYQFLPMAFSDRAQVRRCIGVMLEASRRTAADASYDDLRMAVRDIEAAHSVQILSRRDTPWGSETITTMDYEIDGRRRRIMCSM